MGSIAKSLFSFSLLCFTTVLYAGTPSLLPVQLRCEYLANPLAIDTRKPRFSWVFQTKEQNQFQSAFEIIVSTDKSEVMSGRGEQWNSAKVSSGENIQIVYEGKPLQSTTRYYWRVRIYNQNNELSDWSEIAWFETAMLDPSDWKAKWIGDERKNPERDEDYYKPDRMPLFRKQFAVNKKVESARLYISGLGYNEPYLNGKKIGDHVLDPGFTTYKKQVLYSAYDITEQLRSGTNTISVMMGSGWWNPLPIRLFGRWDLRQYQQTGRPCLKAEIHVHYTDGSVDKITTDNTWLTAQGPIIHNSVYLGEVYDARLEQNNWSVSSPVNKQWKNATIVSGPFGVLTPQLQPPVRITKVVKPVRITEIRPDTFLVDLGQNFAGVARIRVKGKAGTRISMRYGEDLFKDGRLNVLTSAMTQIKKGMIKGGPGAPETAWQEDDYILKGTGVETWSPRFTFHGFRYIEITGWPGKPTTNDIEGLRMNADVEQVGNFACSNNSLNKLHEAIQWTFLSNIFSVQSDCPGREKMGYGADIVVTANAFLYNYNMAQFYRKTVRDFANEQRPEGGITEIAPFTGIADRGYGDDSGPLGWELVFPYTQKLLYDYYGDKRVIEDSYDALNRQLKFLQAKTVEGLFHWDISDHEALDTKPEAFTASAFYYHHARLAEEIAGILSRKDDSIKYHNLADQIRQAIVRKYLVPGTGRFDNATQSAQIFALWYNLSPEIEKSWTVLMNEFARHNWHVATGIYSTKMMFDLFRTRNENDLAYKIASQPDFPGWLNMLNNGATTLWETWAYPESIPSQNHPMFGSIDEWFYRSLLGINSEAPGFGKFVIKPQPAGDLKWVKGSYLSIRGEITSEWSREADRFTLHVVIPGNTQASIYLPAKESDMINMNGSPLTNTKFENGYRIIQTGSGTYDFTVISSKW